MRNFLIITIQFIALNIYASSPSLVIPFDSLVTIDNEIQFSWDNIQNTEFYELEISATANFSSSNLYTVYSNDTIISNVGNGDYYWRIRAIVNSTPSTYSQTRFFSIIDINSYLPKAWFNSDSSLIYNDANSVEIWEDISGNSNHASQSVPSYKPDYETTVEKLNGHPSLLFDGTTLLNTPDLNVNSLEVLFIGKGTPSVQNTFLGIGLGYRVNGPGGSGGIIFLTGSHFQYFQPVQNMVGFKYHNFGFLNGNATESSFLRINKYSLTKGIPAFDNTYTVNNLKIGGSSLNGEIAEILVFDRHLTNSEKKKIEAYLYFKYAPPVNLGPNISQYGFCDTTLYAGKRFESYLWSDGSIEDSMVISESGTYWVETVDIFGQVSRDTINVTFPDLQYPSTQLYCQNESITWQTDLGQHYSYEWSNGSTGNELIIDTPGDFHVIVTDTNGCIFKSDTLTFAEDPFSTTTSLGPDISICSGNEIGLTSGANNSINYLWNTEETTPNITINTTGTYSVIVQNDNGCEVKDTIDVTILGDAPLVQIQAPDAVCTAEEFTFEDLSTTTDGSSIVNWTWTFGDGESATTSTGNHSYTSSGVNDITLVIETSVGCFNNQTVEIEVKANPELTYSTSNVCRNDSTQFNGGQLSPQTITNWEWNFADPSSGVDNEAVGQNTSHVFNSSGDYDVMLIGTDIFGCVDTLTQTNTIKPIPMTDFTFNEVCEGGIVSFQNTTAITPPGVVSSTQWNFGDGTNSLQNNPQKPYSAHGTYSVSLTATADNGCSQSTSKDIKIHATPQVQHVLEQNCAGLETVFNDASFVSNGSVAEVSWKFDNQTPLNGFDITKTFTTSGSYTLEQTVSSGFGCIKTKTSDIIINPYLNADFTFSPSAFITEYPITFESTSTGENEYSWSFGDFASSQQADTAIVFEEDQIGQEQIIKLVVKNQWNCTDSMSIKRPVLKQRTDLDISQLFSQEENGFITIGVRLKNLGSTPINKVDLVLRSPSNGFIKETWTGTLQADEEEIYIFHTSPSSQISDEDTAQDFLCVVGNIVEPAQFIEKDLSNNEVCKTMTENQTVIIQPYPNPVKDELTVKVVMPEKGVIALKIYNNHGELVHVITEDQELVKGLNIFVLDTNILASGYYKIVYEGKGNAETRNFVKI